MVKGFLILDLLLLAVCSRLGVDYLLLIFAMGVAAKLLYVIALENASRKRG